MKKDDEFFKDEPDDGSKSLIGAALLFSGVAVLLIIGTVLLLNKDSLRFKKNNDQPVNNQVSGYVDLDDYISVKSSLFPSFSSRYSSQISRSSETVLSPEI